MDTSKAPDISGMTIAAIQELVNQLHAKSQSKPKTGEWLWTPNSCYHIRTGTHHYTGRFVGFNGPNNGEIAITDAAWIPDDGRFADAIKSGKLNEVEPYPDGAVVGINREFINSFVQVGWTMPRIQK